MALLPVKGYEGLYLVSDEGDIYSLPRKVSNGRGEYIRKGQKLKSFLRIVAEAFVPNPNPDEFTVVNHIDRNPLNNSADNLEWCDQQYNNEYSHNKRICQYLDGEKIAEYKSITYASKLTGVSRTAIKKGCDDLSHLQERC